MHILVEEYQYKAMAVKDILHGIDALSNVEGKVSIHYVGYYYNTLLHDCVFILPKVILEDKDGTELVFGKYQPEDIIDLSKADLLTHTERDFLYKFAVWVYRAIVVFKNDRHNNTNIVYHAKIAQVGGGQRRLSNTYLDILLSLIQFNRDNRNFIFFILRNLHSGFNKINWTRTIATSSAIVQRNRPLYLNPVNKKRRINFDEELLIIFYSILYYIGETYGFAKETDCQFELITGSKFKVYLKGFGCTRLRQIKYKYFSDKALELWNLCYAFFDEARQVSINTEQKEYLLVKDFHIVFEAIIDELIGDNPLPDGMEKRQEDGRIIDHLFTAESLIEGERKPTYYIGDSKYYKIGHTLGDKSINKQYAYARNVIQWNLDLFLDQDKPTPSVCLRDDVTEGYNIIPNFFISAKMDESFNYSNDGIDRTDKDNKHHREQFKNRLFDRDTLLLFHYDVNFLFVLSLYARNNRLQKAAWKSKMRKRFRKEIQVWLEQDYNFYAMRAKPGIDGNSYIRENFKDVLGKVYSPFQEKEVFSLALDKTDTKNNSKLLSQLEGFFFVEKCPLGKDPNEVLPPAATIVEVDPTSKALVLCITRENTHLSNVVDKILEHGKIGVALQKDGATLQLVEGFTKARYLLVHNKGDRQELFFFNGKGPKLLDGADCKDIAVTKKDAHLYLVYEVETHSRPSVGKLDLSAITKVPAESYNPQLLPLQALKNENV